MAGLSPAREQAFQILLAVERGNGHSDTLLRGRKLDALSEADRKLTTALVLGVLRWQTGLDRGVRPLLKHPNAKLDAEVLIALRLGAFQLQFMDRIPARAAIDESVELTKRAGHRFASGMVNAVLRKLAAGEAASQQDATQAYPGWMVDRWKGFYGEEATRVICDAGQEQPATSLRWPGGADEAELADGDVAVAPGEILSSARQVVSGDVTKTAAFCEGLVRIQDEGSQLIAELLPQGSMILDCCAAPGGKTLILAERNPDANIVACDGSHQRLGKLRVRLRPLGDRVECRLADMTHFKDEAAFDVALADVPCSGTGTLGRNPEIRHRLRTEDLPRQTERQSAILRSALRAVRPGGYVLYSTCSLEPEENERVIEDVLLEWDSARTVPLGKRIEELRSVAVVTDRGAEKLLRAITPQGALRLLPGAFHTDGFFAALIAKEH